MSTMPADTDNRSTPPARGGAVLLEIARDIKLSHTLFALPFALLGMCMAAAHSGIWQLSWAMLGLILLCMVTARSFAMTVNRYADAGFDALNPRTLNRAVAAGRVSPRAMAVAALVSGGGFWLAAAGFLWTHGNPWPMLLAPAVLLWIGGYSYTKRVTWLCHLYLGVALALSPLAAAIAIDPATLGAAPIWLLAAMVLFWVAGFDCLYALADQAVDRRLGLHSIPAAFGATGTLWIARALHLLAMLALAALVHSAAWAGGWFITACVLTGLLLVVEHVLAARRQLPMAFATVNGLISVLLGASGIYEIWRMLG